jgi:hypothetical protein
VTSPALAEEWDAAAAALLLLRSDGTVARASRRLLEWTARTADEFASPLHISQLLTVGGRIYWETHLAPLLAVEGRLDEVALDLLVPHGRLPVLLSAVTAPELGLIRVALSSAQERHRFEQEVVAARRAAESAAAQVRALQTVTSALADAVALQGVARALLVSVTGRCARAAGLWLLDKDELIAVDTTDVDPPALSLVQGLGAAAQTAGTPGQPDRIVVPLVGPNALHGALALLPRTEPEAALDLPVLSAIGQQAGLALDRAKLFEASADVAHRLQQALLAGEPPADQRYTVATVYRPGVEALEVGGDWYDVFWTDQNHQVLSLSVGDVVGRGLSAAGAMGQLRSATRAVASPELGPAGLLTRLDGFAEQVEEAVMATMAYAELDLQSGRLRYACAGHPPPLLLPTAGSARFLWDGRSTPLGASVQGQPREEGDVFLTPGDRLLLCTDGLFERRDRGIDVGLELVRVNAERQRDRPVAQAVTALTDVMLQDEQGRDDVCVLQLLWSGPRFR